MIFPNLSFGHTLRQSHPYVSKLEHHVRWQGDRIQQGRIDQTQLSISDSPIGHKTPFSFLVIGDTDPGLSSQTGFAEAFAHQLCQEIDSSRFLLHTGDITYPAGTYENYFSGFLQPYSMLLSDAPKSAKYSNRPVVFRLPVLPVPGNHDCGKMKRSVLHKGLLLLCDRLRYLGIDLGHYGGDGGEAYAQLFLDNLAAHSSTELTRHLAEAYSAACSPVAEVANDNEQQHCLYYQPGQFTRLPNRYYQFHYGGIDFFALDSNSWNTSDQREDFDQRQLNWLEDALVASHQNSNVQGRVIYLHHSPYTTEELRWQQPETLWVRRHLRAVLGKSRERLMAAECARLPARTCQTNSLVDLVISGHAHCLEHVKSVDTGYADGNLDWLVCGGSGISVRRQRKADANILERLTDKNHESYKYTGIVAKSQMYVGRHSRKQIKQNLHTFMRVDVRPDQAQLFSIQPFVVTQSSEGWQAQKLAAINIESKRPAVASTSNSYR